MYFLLCKYSLRFLQTFLIFLTHLNVSVFFLHLFIITSISCVIDLSILL